MIERYTRPEMARLWTDEYRFEKMLQVELLASEALVHKKVVPAAALAKMKASALGSMSRASAKSKKRSSTMSSLL